MKHLAALLALAIAAFATPATAAYPEKVITLIVPWAAGGSTDLSVRPLAAAAEKQLGQPVIIVNKPGANATIGMGELARAQPDGYTIGVYNAATYMGPLTTFTVAYDPISSFSFISYFGDNLIGVVVRKDAKWETLNDLVEDAKRNPGRITVAVPGGSTTEAMMTQGLETKSGARFLVVPFAGVAPVMTALLGGHVDFITATSSWAPNVARGELRLLALNSVTRSPSYPAVPTLNELGYPYMRSIATLAAPAGIPEDRRRRLEDAFRAAARTDAFQKVMEGMRIAIVDMSGEDTTRAVEAEFQKAKKFFGK